MELYKTYPKLCTAWCCFEILIYAGQMFGWSSLLFILKEEGFYLNLCFVEQNENGSNNMLNDIDYKIEKHVTGITSIKRVSFVNNTTEVVNDEAIYDIKNMSAQADEITNITRLIARHNVDQNDTNVLDSGCGTQDSRLNLWFSVAICVSYIACAFLGPIMQKIGMRSFRLFLMVIYITGALCLGFATPVSPWLVCPGLCCIGVAGMALYSTNIQVSFLFPSMQSTITSIFVGLYDASTVVTQLVKLAFENGISRKHSYIALSILHCLLIGTSTLLFLPSIHIVPATHKVKEKKNINKEIATVDKELEVFISKPPDVKAPLRQSLFSGQYVLHVYWMCVQAIRFVTFLGFLNVWLQSKFNGDQKRESYYLSVFSYVTLGTAITALTAGLLHDCQRRKYLGTGDYQRRRLPILVPLVMTTFLSIITTSLTFLENESVLNITFFVFTLYRSYLFSYEVMFLNDAFPLEHFTVLFGLLHSSAGMAGMLQYPLFEWYKAYEAAPMHVNLFLLCLEVSAFIHPLYVWYRCKHHKQEPSKHYLNQEIKI